jgi:hypothetical protein
MEAKYAYRTGRCAVQSGGQTITELKIRNNSTSTTTMPVPWPSQLHQLFRHRARNTYDEVPEKIDTLCTVRAVMLRGDLSFRYNYMFSFQSRSGLIPEQRKDTHRPTAVYQI